MSHMGPVFTFLGLGGVQVQERVLSTHVHEWTIIHCAGVIVMSSVVEIREHWEAISRCHAFDCCCAYRTGDPGPAV